MPKIWFETAPPERRRAFGGRHLLALLIIAAGAWVASGKGFQPARSRVQQQGLELGKADMTKLHELLLESGSTKFVNLGRLPSTEALPQNFLEDGLPTVSIVCDEGDLISEEKGILTHPMERGRRWERPATVTYFEGGRMKYETAAGLRVHGGMSRKDPVKSFQLVFRRSYSGSSRSTAGIFFEGTSQPYRRLVLAKALESHRFLNPMALEIAEKAGCVTSKSQPVRVVLNGTEMPSGYFLFEHQSREFLRNHFGHDDFEWIRLKGGHRSSDRFSDLERWPKRAPAPLRMADVEQRIHLDDICGWVLAITLCGTTDQDQGGYFLDLRNPDTPWRSMAWDMDGSFIHRDPSWEAVVRFERLQGIRGRIFHRLCAEDPAFPDYYRDFARRFFDERFSRFVRRSLVEKYRGFAKSPIFARTSAEKLRHLDKTEILLERRSASYIFDFDQFIAGGAVPKTKADVRRTRPPKAEES